MNHVKVNIDVARNLITVWNNGDCIPFDINGDFVDCMDYFQNIFLTEITAADVKHDKLYKQVFLSDLDINKTEPDINARTISENWTMFSFNPGLVKFGMECLEDTAALMKRRVVDLAGHLKDVKVELNGKHVQLETFEDYAKLYLGTSAGYLSIYEHLNDILEICVAIADGNCEQVSFVNNVMTMKVESHVDYITGQITSYLGRIMNVEPSYIKSHLWVFVNVDLRTKVNMMKGTSRSACKLTPHFLKRIANAGVINQLWSYADIKENQELKKINGKGEWKLKFPELEDACFAGTTYSEDCTLILTQGTPCKLFAMLGLSVVGQDYYGIFPMKGKLLNVRETSSEKVWKNAEIQNIMAILGLEYGKTYEDAKQLRYGHLMIMVDQDPDGTHFKGLLINFLHFFWPSLLKVSNFILDFRPPIVKASIKETKDVSSLPFSTMAEYEAWKETLGDKATEYEIKYRKGLATSETEEVMEYFADLDKYTKEFVWVDEEDGDAIVLAFDKTRIEPNKSWLRAHQARDSKGKRILYRDFINKELIPFLNQTSIPSVVDGLKLGQRKILFCAFKMPLIEAIQVSKLSFYVCAHSAYYDGNASLVDTIIGMAQNYVGSNNINLLQPKGQFGTRRMGGKDHSSHKYIFTQLSPITRYIFHKADELHLNHLNDNGQSIEPAWFIPIIPMVLVNGTEGRGIGWSSFIPNYNPRVIIANLIQLLNGKAMVPMKPWYRWFKGDIKKKKSGYITRGMIQESKEENALEITELPVGMWTHTYEKILQAASHGKDKFIEAYTAPNNDDEKVCFKIYMTKDQINTAKEEGLRKKFKLTTTLSTANMYLFDANGVIKKYNTPEQILKEFIDIRLPFYYKRMTTQRCELSKVIRVLENKLRYISLVCDKTIELFKIKPVDMPEVLEKNGFEKVEEGYDYLLSMGFMSFTKEKIEELKQEKSGKQNDLDVLNKANTVSLWEADLVALDEQLGLDGYPPAKLPLDRAEETPKEKAPAKRTASSSLPQRATKKRL